MTHSEAYKLGEKIKQKSEAPLKNNHLEISIFRTFPIPHPPPPSTPPRQLLMVIPPVPVFQLTDDPGATLNMSTGTTTSPGNSFHNYAARSSPSVTHICSPNLVYSVMPPLHPPRLPGTTW